MRTNEIEISRQKLRLHEIVDKERAGVQSLSRHIGVATNPESLAKSILARLSGDDVN